MKLSESHVTEPVNRIGFLRYVQFNLEQTFTIFLVLLESRWDDFCFLIYCNIIVALVALTSQRFMGLVEFPENSLF